MHRHIQVEYYYKTFCKKPSGNRCIGCQYNECIDWECYNDYKVEVSSTK